MRFLISTRLQHLAITIRRSCTFRPGRPRLLADGAPARFRSRSSCSGIFGSIGYGIRSRGSPSGAARFSLLARSHRVPEAGRVRPAVAIREPRAASCFAMNAMNAIELSPCLEDYRRFGNRRQFATLKSALLSGSLIRDLKPDEAFTAFVMSASRCRLVEPWRPSAVMAL